MLSRLYEQQDGQPGVRLKKGYVHADGTYYFVYHFLNTHSARFFVRTDGNYINLSAESTPKYRRSTY